MKLIWHLLTITLAMASIVSTKSSEVKQQIAVTSLRYDGSFTPPDPIGAAGPKSIIAVVNSAIQAMDRSGNEKWKKPLDTFF